MQLAVQVGTCFHTFLCRFGRGFSYCSQLSRFVTAGCPKNVSRHGTRGGLMLLCWSQLDRVVWYRALNRVSVFCSWPINVLQKPGSAPWGVPFFLVLCQLFYCSCVSIIDNDNRRILHIFRRVCEYFSLEPVILVTHMRFLFLGMF